MRWLAPLLVALMLAGGAGRAEAQLRLPIALAAAPAAPAAAMSPEQAKAALSVLQDEGKRAALIASLRAVAAEPAGAAAAEDAAPLVAALPVVPDGLAAQVLTRAAAISDEFADQISTTARALIDLPLFVRWAGRTAIDPQARVALLWAVGEAALALALALVGEAVAIRVLRHPDAWLLRMSKRMEHAAQVPSADLVDAADSALDRAELGDTDAATARGLSPYQRLRAAAQLLRRIPYVLGRLLLALIPLLVFAGVARAAARQLGSSPQSITIIRELGGSYLVARGVIHLCAALLAPHAAGLRLVGLSNAAAQFSYRWLCRIIATGTVFYALPEIGDLFGMYPEAHEALLKLGGLAVHLLVVLMIWHARAPVADWLRGDGSVRGGIGQLRQQFAESWHAFAIILVLGLWLVTAMELHNGPTAVLHFLLVTFGVIGASRIAAIVLVGGLARFMRRHREDDAAATLGGRLHGYAPLLRTVLHAAILTLTGLALLQVWGIDAESWFVPGALGGRLLATAVRLVLSGLAAIAIWEMLNLWLTRHLGKLSADGEGVRAARLRTLLPMLRTTLMVALVVILALSGLAEIGVDISPLLAGAGIIGVAIGFGSQKLVQDLITGIFLLLENAVQVGDTVTVAGLTGVVEHLSIRTIRLRASDGSVHIIPFSTVGTVTNVNRGVANAQILVELEFDEDIDRVFEGLRAVVGEMRMDPNFDYRIAGDLVLQGVDKVDASTVTVLGQIPCVDTARWPVQREFNRRWKLHVAANSIMLARRSQEWSIRHPLDVRIDPPAVSAGAAQ